MYKRQIYQIANRIDSIVRIESKLFLPELERSSRYIGEMLVFSFSLNSIPCHILHSRQKEWGINPTDPHWPELGTRVSVFETCDLPLKTWLATRAQRLETYSRLDLKDSTLTCNLQVLMLLMSRHKRWIREYFYAEWRGALSAPAPSAPIKRIFSHGGIIMRPHLARLSDRMLGDLIFLKCNHLQKYMAWNWLQQCQLQELQYLVLGFAWCFLYHWMLSFSSHMAQFLHIYWFGLLDYNAGPSFGSYRLIKKCCVKIPLFKDIVIVIMGDFAITGTKLNEKS